MLEEEEEEEIYRVRGPARRPPFVTFSGLRNAGVLCSSGRSGWQRLCELRPPWRLFTRRVKEKVR